MTLNLKDPERSDGEDSPWAGASVLWGLATVVVTVVVAVYLHEWGFREAADFLGYLCWVWGFFAWIAASLYYTRHPRPPSRVLWPTRAWFGESQGQFPGPLVPRWKALQGATTRSTLGAFVVGIILFALLGASVNLTKPIEDSLHPDALRRAAGLGEQSWARPSDLQTTNLAVVPVIPHGAAEHSQLKGYDLTVLIRDESTLPAKIQGELVALDCDRDACTVSGRGRLRIDDFIIPRGGSRELKATVWLDSPKPAQHVRRWELRFDAVP